MTRLVRAAAVALALQLAPAGAAMLRATPVAAATNASAPAAHPAAPSAEDVEKLRAKLVAVANGLDVTLSSGGLAESKVAPAMQAFVKTLRATLNETVGIKNTTVAMQKLRDAKAGIASLTGELSRQEEALMKGDEAQKISLLLGVLMVRQKQPMDKQFDILTDNEFRDLDVSQALLAQHDTKTPLYLQAAAYIDQHGSAEHAEAKPAKKSTDESKRSVLEKTAASLEKRVQALQREKAAGEKQHAMKLQSIRQALAKMPAAKAERTRTLEKKLERNYQKWSQLRAGEIEGLQSAAVAIRSGDMKALLHAREALTKAVQAVQAQTGGFLHFLQLGHRLANTDCPYCAAQCLEKCHNLGKAYVTCLGDCADAGKGK